MAPLFKKAACLLLTVLCMNTQAFEAKLTVNGCDVATLAKDAGTAFFKQADKALISAGDAFNSITVPCFWQYKDGNLHTTHMYPGYLLFSGFYGCISLAAFYKAWDTYQESKKNYKSEVTKQSDKLAALGYFAGGCITAGFVAWSLYAAPRVVTTTRAQFIQGL